MSIPNRHSASNQNGALEHAAQGYPPRSQSRRITIPRNSRVDAAEEGKSPPPPYHPTDQSKATRRPSRGPQHETREAHDSAFNFSEMQARTRELAADAAPMAENTATRPSERLLSPEQQLGRQGSRYVSRDARHADENAEFPPSRVHFERDPVSAVMGAGARRSEGGAEVRLKSRGESEMLQTRELVVHELVGPAVSRRQSGRQTSGSRRESVHGPSRRLQRYDAEVSVISRTESYYRSSIGREDTPHQSMARHREAIPIQSKGQDHDAAARQSRHEPVQSQSRAFKTMEAKVAAVIADHQVMHPGSRGFMDLDSVKDKVFQPSRHLDDAEFPRSLHSHRGAGPSKQPAHPVSAVQSMQMRDPRDMPSYVSQGRYELVPQENLLEQAIPQPSPGSHLQPQPQHTTRCHGKFKYKDNWVQEFACQGCHFSQSYKAKTFRVRHPDSAEVMHLSQYKVRAYHVPVSREGYADERLNCLICKICYRESGSLSVFDNDELMMHFKRHDMQDLVDCYY